MCIELEKGNLDIIERLSTTDYDRLVAEGASKGIIVKNTQNGDLTYITFGYLSNPVFYDVNVRKAIAYGVDWNALGQMAYGQLHKAPSGMLASSSPYFIETGEYEYNFDDAKQILTDAGYKDGDIVLNWLAFDNSMYKNLTQGMQYYLNQLGIEVNITYGDMPTTLQKWMTPGASDLGYSTTLLEIQQESHIRTGSPSKV